MLLRSPGPISPDTYSGHIRRRALCPNRLRNGLSQRSSSSCQSNVLPTMVGPSKSRPPMSHRKTDLGIPRPRRTAKVVLVQRPSLRNFSDQLSRGHLETCLLLFFGQILLRVLTATMRELAASFVPFFGQP